MTLLHSLSYVAGAAGFLFVTLSLASGLLWLAEVIEEHSRLAKLIGQRAIYAIILLHGLLLIVDSLPLLPTLLGILAHLSYLSNFSSTWPYIRLASPQFITSCLLVVADHFVWFFHFAAVAQERNSRLGAAGRYRRGLRHRAVEEGHGFGEVAAFFGVCVWLVPLFLFLSLSANDNALPSNLPSTPKRTSSPSLNSPSLKAASTPAPRQSLLKSLLTPLLALPFPRLSRRRRAQAAGLIALHSPAATASPILWGSERDSQPPSSWSAAPSPGPGKKPGLPSLKLQLQQPPPPRRIASESALPRGVTLEEVNSNNHYLDPPTPRASRPGTPRSSRPSSPLQTAGVIIPEVALSPPSATGEGLVRRGGGAGVKVD